MVSDVKEIYHSRTVAIPRKVRETVQGVQSASLASSSTMESEAATMDDRGSEAANNTIDANSRCYYADSFHNGGAVKPAFAVRMKSKATPRWTHACDAVAAVAAVAANCFGVDAGIII